MAFVRLNRAIGGPDIGQILNYNYHVTVSPPALLPSLSTTSPTEPDGVRTSLIEGGIATQGGTGKGEKRILSGQRGHVIRIGPRA